METQQVNSQISAFGLRLFKELPTNSNLIFSPASIYLALAMAGLGSNSQTLQEFKDVLGFENPQQFAKEVSNATQLLLTKSEGIQTRIANKIYSGLPNLKAEYQTMMKESFNSPVEQVNFKTEYEQVRLTINKWVEEVTNDKIKDLLQSGTLTPSTVMVLVNAIYFKGNWDEQFPKHNTYKSEFNVSANSTVQVDYMSIEKKYPYFENDSCQYVQIPYKGKEYMMEVILPKESVALSQVEGDFSQQVLHDLRQNAHETKINLGLPKFKIEDPSANSLKFILSKLGLKKCFQGDADFSGMDESKEIFIDDVVHKAMIEVNEEGAEAAAATAILMRCLMMEFNPEVRCTRPFLYTISHKPTGSILFMGRVNNPAESK
ncbi:proteinase inhibitor I4 serpin (macronuclear) [Tetrahymena thermophila SB210]|uniref:Proteinase inhibitor I4 serpin n=1 Tax=Tetrahymena thermophila (strain SB210) TaxID=312017 RepID=I7MHL9_TETTS|nr:proteinase inhibitor I4 serpin [Tetrahymena thermophila SB210]EAR87685.1 proteinase inhibitor I4 serpin [Tetrahymena thermophila SB210]|eukprot:XP_001007930.1 proteinase inhibitor I4 serpin [Tetrahymena thermophila SB210]